MGFWACYILGLGGKSKILWGVFLEYRSWGCTLYFFWRTVTLRSWGVFLCFYFLKLPLPLLLRIHCFKATLTNLCHWCLNFGGSFLDFPVLTSDAVITWVAFLAVKMGDPCSLTPQIVCCSSPEGGYLQYKASLKIKR